VLCFCIVSCKLDLNQETSFYYIHATYKNTVYFSDWSEDDEGLENLDDFYDPEEAAQSNDYIAVADIEVSIS
jgi:hypothetical protein